jgi:uncharacterized iron-regulated membrane protein
MQSKPTRLPDVLHAAMVLRDLHSVGGMYVAIVATVISLSGLIYTYVWGSGFQYVRNVSPIVLPAKESGTRNINASWGVRKTLG